VISADESETIEIQKKTMDWTGELAELFGRANTEGIHRAIQGLRTKYNGEFDASELFKELDQIKPLPLDLHLARRHDRYCLGPLPDRHADLEEMFQHPSISGDTSSSTIGSAYANSQSTPDSPCYTGDQ
jgi:hypothetical protein